MILVYKKIRLKAVYHISVFSKHWVISPFFNMMLQISERTIQSEIKKSNLSWS